ncbi:MAG: hypothetical protein MUC87_02480 [Bacteroidia bacterium]|jgi:hypothetical protein|nr:hypothetical protein [Bacteroidia bacterium]
MSNKIITWFRKNYFPYILLHLILTLAAWFFLQRNGIVNEVPDNGKMAHWDAGIYQSIAGNGYIDYDDQSNGNVGMYPGFPFIWWLTDMNDLGISLLNWLFAVIGIVLLARNFEWKPWQLMLMLAWPSSMFFLAPYGESLFLLGSSIALVGMHRNNLRLLFIGLFISATVRAIGMFFLPALLFMAFMQIQAWNWQSIKPVLRQFAVGFSALLAGTFTVMLVQWIQVGDPFAYFYIQFVRCRHLFTIPEFPLTTWDSYRLLWLDGSAFWFCLLAFLGCMVWGLQKLLRKMQQPALGGSTAVWFAAGYLTMSLIFLLFYNPYDGLGGTTLYAANRYVFASPFFMILLMWFLNRKETPSYYVYIILGVILLTIPLLGNDTSFNASPLWGSMKDGKLFYRLFMFLPWAFLLLLQGKNKFTFQWALLYVACLFMQLYIYDAYIKGVWIG